MKNFPLDLDDLVPKEATFTLSDEPERPLTLCRWSLRIRAWATAKYSPQGLRLIFQHQQIEEIADMAYFMLKEKHFFPNQDAFMDAIVTIKDQVAVIKALLAAVGIGEPEIEKINKSIEAAAPAKEDPPDPKPKAKRKIGAKSSTR